jgi:hypothetical protein
MKPLTFSLPALSHTILDLVYPAPRAGRNPEHNLRLQHRDLALRSLDDLQREHERLAARIALEGRADAWMAQRLALLRAELAHRSEGDAQ